MISSLVRAIVCLFFLSVLTAAGQSWNGPHQQTTEVHDVSALKPPAGARVAIVEFSDLECPACARENPLLMDAVARYHIPWMRHDFPLRQHPWSFQAAVNARWFDTKSKKFGDEYRDAVFANQTNIETVEDLRNATDKFAKDRGLALPFVLDPQNQLSDQVKADAALGERIGIHETPTVWIVTSGGRAAPYTQVTDPSQLFSMIDRALADTKPPAKALPKAR